MLKEKLCTNCFVVGHTRGQCKRPPACKACKKTGHTAGDARCEAHTTKQKQSAVNHPTSPLSNLYESELQTMGMTFTCVEQAYLYSKAIQRGQPDIADEILKAPSPSIARSKGKFLRYDPNWTTDSKKKLMKQILEAKVEQNEDFVDALKATVNTRIVYAHPNEYEWGTGLNEEQSCCTKMKFWPGKNLLGTLLEDIRSMVLSNSGPTERRTSTGKQKNG